MCASRRSPQGRLTRGMFGEQAGATWLAKAGQRGWARDDGSSRGASWVLASPAQLLAAALEGTILPLLSPRPPQQRAPARGLPGVPRPAVDVHPRSTTRWRHWPPYRTGPSAPRTPKDTLAILPSCGDRRVFGSGAAAVQMGRLRPSEGRCFAEDTAMAGQEEVAPVPGASSSPSHQEGKCGPQARECLCTHKASVPLPDLGDSGPQTYL